MSRLRKTESMETVKSMSQQQQGAHPRGGPPPRLHPPPGVRFYPPYLLPPPPAILVMPPPPPPPPSENDGNTARLFASGKPSSVAGPLYRGQEYPGMRRSDYFRKDKIRIMATGEVVEVKMYYPP